MAALAPQKSSASGLVVTYAAAGGSGDTFPYSKRRALRVKNASGGSINVTIVAQRACEQGVLHDKVVAVGAGVEKNIGPITDHFKDDGGVVHVTYSAVTTVTVAVVEV